MLNAVDKTRGLVLSNNVYESSDQFDNLTLLAGGSSPLLASAYGGACNANVIYVANASGLFVRTGTGNAFSQITGYSGQTAVDISLDPDSWLTAVIADAGHGRAI